MAQHRVKGGEQIERRVGEVLEIPRAPVGKYRRSRLEDGRLIRVEDAHKWVDRLRQLLRLSKQRSPVRQAREEPLQPRDAPSVSQGQPCVQIRQVRVLAARDERGVRGAVERQPEQEAPDQRAVLVGEAPEAAEERAELAHGHERRRRT
eukprot:409227-Pleurochrysis_carterae.AAC.2